MKNLRKEIIRLAHSRPEIRKDLLPLLVSKTADEDSKAFKKFLEDTMVDNPDTDRDEKVQLRTLKNSPPDSAAHRKYQKIKKQWEEESNPEDSGKGEGNEGEGDDKKKSLEEGKSEKAEKASKEFISGSKSKLKEIVTKVKEKVKEKFIEYTSHEVSLGEITEMFLNLLVTAFDGREGKKMLDDVMETVDARNDENFKAALAELKSSQLAAIGDEDTLEKMKNMGLDPTDPDLNNEKIREWLTDEDKEGEPIPEDIAEDILDFFFKISKGHVEFLHLFIEGNGDVDLKQLREFLKDGIPDDVKKDIEIKKKKEEDDDENKAKKESARKVALRIINRDPSYVRSLLKTRLK